MKGRKNTLMLTVSFDDQPSQGANFCQLKNNHESEKSINNSQEIGEVEVNVTIKIRTLVTHTICSNCTPLNLQEQRINYKFKFQ